jgi:cytochrome c oxidase subunit 4
MNAHAQAHPKHPTARTFFFVLLALLALTAVTVAAAGVHFGSPAVNAVIALLIASLKGSLVALYFMHLRYDKPLNAVIFCTGLVFLALFLIFCYIDVESREVSIPSTLKVSAPEKK